MKDIKLTQEQLLILQQISEWGEEEIGQLANELRINRTRMLEMVADMRRKGLLRSTHSTWVALSNKGRDLVASMWPGAAITDAMAPQMGRAY